MSTRNIVLAATLAASLTGCVERSDWKPAPRLEPRSLDAQQTLAGARLDAAAWPAEQWWRAYGDPQLDALIAAALAGSPSLEIAEARLRSAQAQAITAGAGPGAAAAAAPPRPPPPRSPASPCPPPPPRRPPHPPPRAPR